MTPATRALACALAFVANAAWASSDMAHSAAPTAAAPQRPSPEASGTTGSLAALSLRQAGQGRMTWLGLDIYDARLEVAPGFSADNYAAHPMRLELTYLRALPGARIAERSVVEMRRVGRFDEAQAQRWRDALQRLLPDVKKGDRIAGIYRPGQGVLFLANERPIGEVTDPEFARLFFGIWLAPQTSAPQLREALLARSGG